MGCTLVSIQLVKKQYLKLWGTGYGAPQELENPRYKVIYKDGKTIGRNDTLR